MYRRAPPLNLLHPTWYPNSRRQTLSPCTVPVRCVCVCVCVRERGVETASGGGGVCGCGGGGWYAETYQFNALFIVRWGYSSCKGKVARRLVCIAVSELTEQNLRLHIPYSRNGGIRTVRQEEVCVSLLSVPKLGA
jgi:hypothetical protein